MKLLIVLRSNFPYPVSTGGQQAVYHMIDYLRNYLDIYLLYHAVGIDMDSQSELSNKWKNVTFIPYTRGKFKRNYFFLKKTFDRIVSKLLRSDEDYAMYKTLDIAEPLEDGMLELIQKTITQEEIDCVQTEFYDALYSVYALPKNVKKVFVQHEIRYVKNKLFLDAKKNELSVRDLYMLNKLKNEEIAAMNMYDMIITLTDIDKEKLEKDKVTVPIYDSPACIPVTNQKEVVFKKADNIFTFLGGYFHKPNADGLEWFLRNVWHDIISKREAHLQIIGKWPEVEIKRIKTKYSNVTFLGFVDNLTSALSETVMIVPILVGSGMRIKILDAVTTKTPFITTTVGVEGLDFIDSESCFVADSPAEFSDKAIKLISNSGIQEKFAENAIKVYNEKFSIEVLGQKRLNIY